MSDLQFPKLRFVDAFPVRTEHGQMIGLRDPSGIASDMLLLSPDVFYLLQFLDGSHSLLDLRNKYLQAFGNLLYEEQLAQILRNLDAHLFLDNQSYLRKRQQLEQAFLAQGVRPAVHAGKSYESDPERLRRQIAGFFSHPDGPGAVENVAASKRRLVRGLIAPHIDIRLGGPCYAHAYKALAESQDIDCFVILGTGHSGLNHLYSTLEMDFGTPFGVARCDREFVRRLKANHAGFACSEVLPHQSEHVIEFQLTFLQYLLQGRREFTFVPILCSFSYHMLDGEQFERERRIVDSFRAALRKTIADRGKKVCLIASVDFSHVGPRYGDEQPPDPAFMAGVSAADRRLLQAVENLDSRGFFESVRQMRDRTRVCGFSSIYTLLRAIEAEKGELLDYSKTVVDAQNSSVTFASVAIY